MTSLYYVISGLLDVDNLYNGLILYIYVTNFYYSRHATSLLAKSISGVAECFFLVGIQRNCHWLELVT